MSAGEAGDLILQLRIGDRLFRIRDGAAVDDGRLIAAPVLDVAVNATEAGVQLATPEPPEVGRVRSVKHCVPGLYTKGR